VGVSQRIHFPPADSPVAAVVKHAFRQRVKQIIGTAQVRAAQPMHLHSMASKDLGGPDEVLTRLIWRIGSEIHMIIAVHCDFCARIL